MGINVLQLNLYNLVFSENYVIGKLCYFVWIIVCTSAVYHRNVSINYQGFKIKQ